MNEKNDYQKEYDSLKDVVEFQNNMFNPGHYTGTGKVPPTMSAPGNATPLAVLCFFAAVLFCGFGLFLFFSDIHITSFDLIESAIANKIIVLIIMIAISLFFLVFAFVYLKKAKIYYRNKVDLQNEEIDNTIEDQILQRTCPKCGTSYDIDYPKCPNCKSNRVKIEKIFYKDDCWHIKPSTGTYDMIYRAARGVYWDNETSSLMFKGNVPQEKAIEIICLAMKEEYYIELYFGD